MRAVILMAMFLGACASPEPASFRVDPSASVTLFGVGGTEALPPVQVLDATGLVLPEAPVTWTVEPATVAEVTADGQIRALADGKATLTAHAGAVTASIPVMVSVADTLKITGLPTTGELTVGKAYELDLRAWADGKPVKAPPATWSVSDPAILELQADYVKVLAPGAAVLTATAAGQEIARELTAVPDPEATVN